MISANLIEKDMNIAEGIAKFMSPFKTGNLRYNAISSKRTDDGFSIDYSLANAHYIYFLEEGTSKSTRHVGFIANKTVPTIASYISAKYETQDKKIIRHFEHYSNKGLDTNIPSWTDFENKMYSESKINVDEMAASNKWEHNEKNDVYDSNFRNRRML
jgi:hypothetical protein